MKEDLLYRLWGKTNEREKDYAPENWRSHPAICHMVDVGYVAERWLAASPWIMERFCLLAPGIDRDVLRRVLVTVVAIHDIGKIHSSFQSKSERGWNKGYGTAPGFTRDEAAGRHFDHGRATAAIFRLLRNKELRKWKAWGSVIDAVAAHHGRLYDASEVAPTAIPGPQHLERTTAAEAVMTLEGIFGCPDQLPEAPKDPAFAMLLAGFCSVSDWFGSNSTVFRYSATSSREELVEYCSKLRASGQAERMLADAGLISTLRRGPLDYPDLFEFIRNDSDLRGLQRLAKSIPFGERPGAEMVIVEAAMGLGKTELALYLGGLSIVRATSDGIYFALPTQASSNAIYDRIVTFAAKISKKDTTTSLALAHGSRRHMPKYHKLVNRTRQLRREFNKAREHGSDYEDGEQDKAAPSEVIAPSWLQSSKRVLLATIGVGTIDQAMLGAIIAKHAFVRLFALAGKTVIFDEIHAYDSYMNVVIVHLLRWLHALGTKVILLSATLSRSLRDELVQTYGARIERSEEGREDPYPLMLHVRDKTVVTFELDKDTIESEPVRQVRVEEVRCANGKRTEVGVAKALELATKGGCVAWIRNTVREAQEAYNALREQAKVSGTDCRILHARFIRGDRNAIEDELIQQLGKDAKGNRPEKIIIIATQVIEQSVDLDFDAMISDVAPMDLLLQRLGRLWRHDRPAADRCGHTEPVLTVLLPTDEEMFRLDVGLSRHIYLPELLARTAELLRNDPALSLPSACRSLVSALYDRDREYWSATRLNVSDVALGMARATEDADKSAMEGRAQTILMPDPRYRGRMVTALRDDDRGDSVALATRYGGSSATAVLLYAVDGGYRLAGSAEVSLAVLPGHDDDDEIYELEEAVALSVVSFPWYGTIASGPLDGQAAELERWWRERNPYDNKLFLVAGHDGRIEHPEFIAWYRLDNKGTGIDGLAIERKRARQTTDSIEFENT